MCSVHLYVILLLKSTSQFHFITCFLPPLHLKYLACSLHVLKMGSVMYVRQLFILSPLRLFHRLQISDRSILQSLKSFQPLVQSKRREAKQTQPNVNCPKTRKALLLKDNHFALRFIRSDQKVSVYLMITIQKAGVRRLFDHSVYH